MIIHLYIYIYIYLYIYIHPHVKYPLTLRYINLLKPFWLRDAPTGLTFNNCMFCPNCICFVFTCQQRTTCVTSSINLLSFITELKSVYCAVRTGAIYCSLRFIFKRLIKRLFSEYFLEFL
jgi:hypothetical protein